MTNEHFIRRDTLGEFLGKKVILSTVRPFAMAWYGKYETAVTFDGQGEWKILKGYNTKEDAIKGHKEFKSMTIDELMELRGL